MKLYRNCKKDAVTCYGDRTENQLLLLFFERMKLPITNKGKSTLNMSYLVELNGMLALANIPINHTKTVNAIADHINVILLNLDTM